MIVYQLRCSNGHEFEAWFRDSGTYDQQAKDGDVACPQCGDVHVCKALMAPNIAPSRKRAPMSPEESDRAERRALEVAEKILEGKISFGDTAQIDSFGEDKLHIERIPALGDEAGLSAEA